MSVFPRSSWNVDSSDHRTRVHCLSVHLRWAWTVFLHRADTWLQVTFLDAAVDCGLRAPPTVVSVLGLRIPWIFLLRSCWRTKVPYYLSLRDIVVELIDDSLMKWTTIHPCWKDKTPFIPNPDTLTCHQVICWPENLPEHGYFFMCCCNEFNV